MFINKISKEQKRKVIKEKLNDAFIEKLKPSKEELDRLNSRMDTNHGIRNDLLKFSFTSVIASLGAALALDNITAPLSFLFLFPFVIMIPFQARIAYYRLEEAHIRTYISKLYEEYDMYTKICRYGYYEDVGMGRFYYICIAWLVNHELVCLSVLTCIIFWVKFFSTKDVIPVELTWLARILPVVLLAAVWAISHSTYSYLEMSYRYAKELKEIQNRWNKKQNNKQK